MLWAVQVYDPHHEIAALLMNDIALCLNIQGNFSDALDMLLEALALFERPGATVLTQQACALAHNNLAVSLAALGRPHEAQTHLRIALRGIRSMQCPFVHCQPTIYLQAALLIHLQEFDAGTALVESPRAVASHIQQFVLFSGAV